MPTGDSEMSELIECEKYREMRINWRHGMCPCDCHFPGVI